VTLQALAAQLTARRGRPDRQAELAGVDRPAAVDQPGRQGPGRPWPPADHPGSAAQVGVGAGRSGMSTRASPAPEWITVPVPALVAAAQFDWSSGDGHHPAQRPASHHPPDLLGGLVGWGICRLACTGSPHRHPVSLLPLPRQDGAGQLRPLELLAGAVPPRHPAGRAGVGGLGAVLQQPELVTQAVDRAHSGAWAPGAAPAAGELGAGAGERDPPAPAAAGASLAEVLDLACFQRQDQTLGQQEPDRLAREREGAAQGERLVGLSAIASRGRRCWTSSGWAMTGPASSSTASWWSC
jgi:hypothetical protein